MYYILVQIFHAEKWNLIDSWTNTSIVSGFPEIRISATVVVHFKGTSALYSKSYCHSILGTCEQPMEGSGRGIDSFGNWLIPVLETSSAGALPPWEVAGCVRKSITCNFIVRCTISQEHPRYTTIRPHTILQTINEPRFAWLHNVHTIDVCIICTCP